MSLKTAITLPSSPVPDLTDAQHGPEMELWEPPFERWLKLADELLHQWPNRNAAQPIQRI
jgi:hypothetical protein